jgi:hypothetical protein
MMKKLLLLFCALQAIIVIYSSKSIAQQPAFRDSLLDHLTGNWVLHGAIAGKQTTHDVTAQWVLNHQYLQIHEVSRAKDAKGLPAYEASVFVGWQQATKQYVCVWLDDYGSISPASFGIAKSNGPNIIPFIFTYNDDIFHTTFKYNPKDNTWAWDLDSEDKGVLKPFARCTLTR